MLIGNRVGKWNKKRPADQFKDIFDRNLATSAYIDICVGFCGVNDNVPVPLRQTSEDEENQKLTRLEIKA